MAQVVVRPDITSSFVHILFLITGDVFRDSVLFGKITSGPIYLCFVFVTKIIHAFVKVFETETRSSFLGMVIHDILGNTLEMFIKKLVMDKAISINELPKIDPSKREN